MDKIAGYSVYVNEEQHKKYNEAHSFKSSIVEAAQQAPEVYGTGLNVFLIFYIFETSAGEFEQSGVDSEPVVSRYSSKDKSIRVTFYIKYDAFESKSLQDQLEYYYRTTMHALSLVKDKFSKKKHQFDFNFDKLIEDVGQGFVKHMSL